MSLERDRIAYHVGNEHNPGDAIGRSQLVIETNGAARLDHHTRSGHNAWTGRVGAPALDDLWRALEEAAFPAMPEHRVPAGAAIRALTVGMGTVAKSAYIAGHASGTMPGYREVFWILDSIIRQLSEDTVRAVAPYSSQIVEAVARATGPAPASPGTVFAIAYLAARRIAHSQRVELAERVAATANPALVHAIELSRQALKTDEPKVALTAARLAWFASALELSPPPSDPEALPTWVAALPELVKPHLPNPVLEAAWKAGEAGRHLAIAVQMAADVAALRCAGPEHPVLREQASERARAVEASAAALAAHLRATTLPHVIEDAAIAETMLRQVSLEPTTADGYRRLDELATETYDFLEASIQRLDTPPEKSRT
jgi:hypothetical protein